MTKNIHKKHTLAHAPKHHEAHAKCDCGCECKEEHNCGCGCGCCKCGPIHLINLSLIVVALILSAWALVKKPCSEFMDKYLNNYINKNPKVIADSVEKYYRELDEKRRAEERAKPKIAPAEIVAKIVNDKTNYSLGNPNGKFVIIEFFDHNCGWCKRTNAAMAEALKKPEAKNIRWIPIDTPIFGEGSELIARYVLAAGKHGKYAQMHEAVGANKGKLDEAALKALATNIGLDAEKVQKTANSDEIKNKLVANRDFTRALNIGGVPMLIVNGKIHPGALFGEELDAVVAESAK